jgi:predicted dehydrogenase
MDFMKFRVGIIGCGNIFPMHAYPVQELATCELVSVCDNKEDRAKAKAKEFNCKAYTNYEEMIDKEKLDVVHVCTPHYMHPPMVIRALEKGSNVLTEKPMSTKYEDAVKMVETADRAGKTLGVIFQNRYNPGSVLAKKILDSGELGKILGAKLDVTWMRTDEYYSKSDWKGTWDKEGGGVMIDQAIHTFDLLRWLLGSEVEYVDCHIENRTHKIIEVEDEADGVIKFKNGVLASFYTINYYSEDSDVHLELHCENGKIHITADAAVIDMKDGRKYEADKVPGESFSYGNVKGYWGVSHIKQIDAFYKSLAKGEKPFIDGHEALGTMQLVLGLYDSGRQKKRITF